MTRKTNTALIALLGTILMGLSTWALMEIIELRTIVAMLQQEILGLDKVIGRIYAHMDRLTKCCLLYTSPSPRDRTRSRMPSSA